MPTAPLHADDTHLRPLDVHRDLPAVAELIDVCFADQMDMEGRDYLRYIRRVANNPALVRWVPGAGERVSMPLYGYVWNEDDKIVGNLTLIPFTSQRRWIYLIANVAVHPDYRRRGIARALTLRALEHIHAHQVSEAWLQVRDDNPAAQALYRSLGFVERVCRTTWQSAGLFDAQNSVRGLYISGRDPADWPRQSTWLQQTYPPEVSWNLAFDSQRLRPGLVRAVAAFINGESFRHFCARTADGALLGAATWEAGRTLNDMLWLAVDPAHETETIRALLTYARQMRLSSRFLTVNYPAGHAQEAFADCGFTPLNTLVWMSMDTRATSGPGRRI